MHYFYPEECVTSETYIQTAEVPIKRVFVFTYNSCSLYMYIRDIKALKCILNTNVLIYVRRSEDFEIFPQWYSEIKIFIFFFINTL